MCFFSQIHGVQNHCDEMTKLYLQQTAFMHCFFSLCHVTMTHVKSLHITDDIKISV